MRDELPDRVGAALFAGDFGVAELLVGVGLVEPGLALVGAILDVRVALFEELDDDSALREEEEARPLLAGVIVGRGERVDFGTEKDRSRRTYQVLRPRRHVLAQGLFGEVRVRRIGQNDEERRRLLRCGRKRQR